MLNENSKIIKEARNLALKEIEEFGLPHLTHFEISEKKALELAKKLNADKIVTSIGIYLMDLKIGEAFTQNKLKEHVKMSAKASKEFLDKFNLDKEIKKKIINCIEAHHKDVPFICKEAEICANADCYRFLHPKGFFTAVTLVLNRNDFDFEKTLNYLNNKIDEKYRILSLDICKRELEGYYHQFKEFLKVIRIF